MKNFFFFRTFVSVVLLNFCFFTDAYVNPETTELSLIIEDATLPLQPVQIKESQELSVELAKSGFLMPGLIKSEQIKLSAENETENAPVASSRSLGVSSGPIAEWAIMIYLQARNNLAPFAAANLDALAAHGGNPNVHFLAQWDQPKKPGCWRYKVEAKNVSLVNYVANENPTDIGGKLVDFVSWAKTNYPAKNYALIFWNHGLGIIDPSFGSKDLMGISKDDPLFLIRKESSNFRFYEDVLDIYTPKKDPIVLPMEEEAIFKEAATLTHMIGIEDETSKTMSKPTHRGILFDEENQSYVNNQDLESCLKKINAIIGKKLAIIGFDACFMSNWEVACQVEQYADFMVGSEELELPRGWDYKRIGEFLANSSGATPEALAASIARSYGQFYQGQTNMYTQTAIRLEKIRSAKVKFNEVLTFFEQLSRDERVLLSVCMQEARRLSVQLTAKVFIDLGSWIGMLANSLRNKVNQNNIRKSSPKIGLERAIVLLQELQTEINGCIVEHITSSYLSKLTGLSIYFPIRSIEASYSNCNFATTSNWLSFVKSTNIF